MLVDSVAFIQIDPKYTSTHTCKNNTHAYGNDNLRRAGCPWQPPLSRFYLQGNTKQWDTSKVDIFNFTNSQ